MKVEALMTKDVRTCGPGDSLATAAQLMWEGDCGWIPVVAEDGTGRVVGIVTDRDICMATHFRGCAPEAVAVGEVMSTGVYSVGPGEQLADAEAIMRDARVRRLPVVDGSQQLIGVISLADLSRATVPRGKAKTGPLSEEQVGGTLTAICEPRVTRTLPASA